VEERATDQGVAAPTLHDGVRDQSPESSRAPGQPDEILPRGTVVGRFIVQRTLGMGATGIVYAARDPELDRTIALKVLRRELADRLNARARFLREAQALARLSHPNVIAVYDVGGDEDRTFIAMEYIAGHTLADWIAMARPAWRQIVAVLVKAGRGLAAAHAADLIHRDFKPANLLVGADGRVVVTDFGLARAGMETEAGAGPAGSPDLPSGTSALAQPITTVGAVQGTPRYMAPEQHEGQPADARTDQYSFCVTLYEALFDAHPHLLPSSGESAAPTDGGSAPGGVVRMPEDVRGAPVWLQRTLQRGLGARPEDRFPSMDALLTALTREPIRRRRRAVRAVAAAGGLLVAGAVALAYAAADQSDEAVCTGGGEQLSAVWNPTAASRIRAAFAATDRSHARTTADGIARRLDAYAGEWTSMHRATCLATTRREQSPELLDRQMVCLDRRLAQLGALIQLFTGPADGSLVDNALDVAARLDPVGACADTAALLSRVPLPVEPARRARVAELERQLDRANLERQAGRADGAVGAARQVLEAEAKLDYAPLAARAGRVLGRALQDLGRPAESREALMQAQRMAEKAGDFRLAAEVMLDLLGVVGLDQVRDREVELLLEVTEASLERPELRNDQMLRARLLQLRASIATERRRVDPAITDLREALAIYERISSSDSTAVATAEESLANALRYKGLYEEAGKLYTAALVSHRRLFGEDHPRVAVCHLHLGTLHHEQGNFVEARQEYMAALKTFDKIRGYRDHPILLNNLGELERVTGNYADARKHHEEALSMRLQNFGPDHPDVAMSLHNLGNVQFATGKLAEALDRHRSALAVTGKARGEDHPTYAFSLTMIGEDLRALGRPAEALDYQQRALKILAPARDQPLYAVPTAFAGLALVDLGRRREARPLLESAYAKIPRGEPDRARAAFGLALALEPRRPRSERAKGLAREALASFTSLRLERERDKVAAYLARAR
jgi:eukaryotic-like serine/threonine-protein kinase